MAQRRERGTGSVYEDPHRPGRWIGEVRVDGKRHRVSGITKTDTRAKLAKITAKRDTGQPVDNQRTTVEEAVREFIARDIPNRDLAPSTRQNYEWIAELLIAEIGKTRLSNLNVNKVEAMLDRLATREPNPLGRATLTKVRGTLQRSIAFAERRGKASRNVALAATITPDAQRAQPRNALAPADARKLLTSLRSERNGAMYALSLLVGLRPGEAAALHWGDLHDGTVNIVRGVRRDGDRAFIADDVKTASSRRTIQLPDHLAAWLAEHRRDQLAERVAAKTWADDNLMFATSVGTVIHPRNARRHLAEICDRAGVPIVRPNELRHSCASLLSDASVPLEQIADLLGHTSTRMLDATYRHRLRPVVDVAALATWADETG